ncbi:uncharacterized protein LOC143257631 [Tachypleus tridentatus]|uniref:uncharacterized protein LOC143257631 n=1 Tax=Tachypleus tridentatus TaxID=6853 RepID=UPI003FD4F140
MHIRQHTGEKPFACDVCVYRTSDHNSLRRHKMQHSGERPYKCPYCSYASIQASTYKTHLKIKHPGMNDGLMFSCKQCSFRTLKKDNLATHISSDHPRSPPEATIEQLKSIGFSKLLHSTLNQSQPSNITVLPNTSQSLSLGEAVDIAVSQGSDGTGSTPLFVFKAIEEFNKKIA